MEKPQAVTHSSAEFVLAAAAWCPWPNCLGSPPLPLPPPPLPPPPLPLPLLLLSGRGLTVASEAAGVAITAPASSGELSICAAPVLCSSVSSWAAVATSSSWIAGGTHVLSSLLCVSLTCISLSRSACFSNSLNVWWGNRWLSQFTGLNFPNVHAFYINDFRLNIRNTSLYNAQSTN